MFFAVFFAQNFTGLLDARIHFLFDVNLTPFGGSRLPVL